MDLLNATGEMLRQQCDGKFYNFPPGELVRLSDVAGAHCLRKQAVRGLQEVGYGDDPDKVTFAAVEAIVQFHQKQITDHETINAEQAEKKFSLLRKSQAVIQAEARLEAYLPIYNKMKKKARAEAKKQMTEEVTRNIARGAQIPELEDKSIDELRDILLSMGGSPRSNMKMSTMIKKIQELSGENKEAVDDADKDGEGGEGSGDDDDKDK